MTRARTGRGAGARFALMTGALVTAALAGCGRATPADRLDRLVREASSVAQGVRRWLVERAHLSAETLESLADQAEARFAQTLGDLRAGAAAVADARVGVRVFNNGAWRRLRDDERLPADIVLLVHGLDEPGDIWDDLAPALVGAGHAVVRFDYPNDQAIRRSSDLLAAALAGLRARGAGSVSIVAHSMGGLLARDALTRAEIYNGRADQPDESSLPDVSRLILCGTPNTGSPLASLRVIAEVREQVLRLAAGGFRPDELLGAIADGAGQAGRDLAVGSAFLNDLNARPAPSGVEITCIVAQMAPADRNTLDDLLESDFARRWLGEAGERAAADLRAALNSIGDGVVPVASARLAGVEDVVTVHANHRTMLVTLDAERLLSPITGEPADPPAIRVILDRLSNGE
ncbi:MAG: alpha/beta fold hydrolase [Planctomycetota bacterium]|nr:MAG: alpha/beta fold hydrolase [Planctomycetota bacterium]